MTERDFPSVGFTPPLASRFHTQSQREVQELSEVSLYILKTSPPLCIDKLLYLAAHWLPDLFELLCLWKKIVGQFVFEAYFYARDVKIVRKDLNVFYRS